MRALTDVAIRQAVSKKSRYELAEPVTGLRLRVNPTGAKVFVWRYRDAGGKQRVVTLGSYPALGLAEARAQLAALQRDRQAGKDPATAVKEAREKSRDAFVEASDAPTVAEILAEYMQRRIEKTGRADTREGFRRLIAVELNPRLGTRKAATLTRTAVVAALDDIADHRTAEIADHAAEVLRAGIRYAVHRGRLDHDPCAGLPRYAEHLPRERTLTEDEIRALWAALTTPRGMSAPMALGIKLLLVTAQRRSSLALAEWREIGPQRWEIPPEHFKSKHGHTVPLSSLAVEILEELRALTGETPYLLPAPNPDRSIRPGALTKALHRLGVEFRLHDLRRTGATLMAESSVSRFTIARVLGHADSSVTAIYDRAEYFEEKHQALTKLARRLAVILGEPHKAEVIALRA